MYERNTASQRGMGCPFFFLRFSRSPVQIFSCPGILFLCAYQLIPKLMEYQDSAAAFDRMRTNAVSDFVPADRLLDETEGAPDVDTADALTIDWDAFEGTDIVAWIQMDAISYPVMQADDNDKYLHHLPDGSYNYGGSIFLYNRNNPLFTDRSSFVYGHNMANGSMFGTLKKYASADYTDHCFYIYLPDGTRRTYRFYCVASAHEASDTYTWSFGSDATFLEWQDYMRNQSFYRNSPEPDVDAKYVTLSTCNGYAGTTHRLVVCGQLERVDNLQKPASWYDAYKLRFDAKQREKREVQQELKEKLEEYLNKRRKSMREVYFGNSNKKYRCLWNDMF